MNEASCLKHLLRALEKVMPGGVGFKHHDTVTAGIPDLSWSWGGRTVWVEAKFGSDGKISPVQDITLRRLYKAGMSMVVWFKAPEIHVYNAFGRVLARKETYVEVATFIREEIRSYV